MADPALSRVLVCVGHLCECQESGGARSLLRELAKLDIEAPIEDAPCLGMCGMGAMGCLEYVDGSERLTAGRDQMLAELGVCAQAEAMQSCELLSEDAVAGARDVQRVLVCTGRVCERLEGGPAQRALAGGELGSPDGRRRTHSELRRR